MYIFFTTNFCILKNGETSSSRPRLCGAVSTAASSSSGNNGNNAGTSGGNAVAELVDLEQELNSLQRGLHQMERLTPPTDPFGDSFTSSTVPVNILIRI